MFALFVLRCSEVRSSEDFPVDRPRMGTSGSAAGPITQSTSYYEIRVVMLSAWPAIVSPLIGLDPAIGIVKQLKERRKEMSAYEKATTGPGTTPAHPIGAEDARSENTTGRTVKIPAPLQPISQRHVKTFDLHPSAASSYPRESISHPATGTQGVTKFKNGHGSLGASLR
ncbi:hypothetical protein ON010_g18224 [Phytophthora cinnamomi]|nr:hypothetical protein ON010_g18224 [Phytophthora cinnamomi]